MKKLYSFIPGISRLVSNVSPLIILFIFTKFVPTEEIGLINYFISLITLIGIFTDIGLPEAMQRFLPQSKNPKELIFTGFIMELGIVLVGSAIIILIDTLAGGTLSKGYGLILILCVIFSSSDVIALTFNGLFQGFRLSVYFLLTSILFLVSTFIFFFVFKINPVESFLYGRLLSWIIFTIAPIIDLFRQNLIEFKFVYNPRFITFALNTFVVAFSYSLFTQWDSILVTNVLGEFENGIYKSAIFVASVPLAFRVILETKLLPEYSKLHAENKITELKESVKKYTLIFLAASIVLTICAVIFDELVLTIIFNSTIATQSNLIFPIAALGTFIYITAVPAVAYLQAIGKENIVRNGALFQSVAFVLLSTLAIYNGMGLVVLPILLLAVNVIFGSVVIFFSSKQ